LRRTSSIGKEERSEVSTTSLAPSSAIRFRS